MVKKASKPVKKIAVKKPTPKKSAPKKIVKKKEEVVKNTTTKKAAVKKVEAKQTKKIAEEKPAIVKKETPKKDTSKKDTIGKKEVNPNSFKSGQYAFYPSHGVGKILEVENTTIGGQKLNILVMYFEKERLTIKIPSSQIIKTGLRHLISKKEMDAVFDILKSGVKKTKGMWSRRAQEYEEKINSGDIVLLAEVLRDLTRDIEDGDRSYSERIIYETAINRLALEYSVIEGISFEEAKEKIISVAKHKLGNSADAKPVKNFDDDFDAEDADEEEEDEDGDDDDDDFDYDDEDDEDAPKKRGRKKKK